MPEKCHYCGECAVIEDSVDGGGEQLICIECGSLASRVTSKESDTCDYDLNEDATLDTQSDVGGLDAICESCGIGLDDTDENSICSDCLQENSKILLTYNDPVANCEDDNISKPQENPDQITTCISCKSTNLSQESINGDERLICLDCGSVNSDTVLTNNEYCSLTRTLYNHVTTLPRFSQRRPIEQGLTAGLSKITYLCSKYCFSDDIKMQAEEMFKNLFYHPKVLHVRIHTKEYIGAACLFIVCRRNHLPISLTHFKGHVDVFKSFLNAKRHVLKVLNIQLPHISITNQFTTFLHDYGLGGQLIAKVKDILFLCRKAWLTQGRCRMNLITIATYYAYTSSDKCNGFISLKQFCDRFKIPNMAYRRSKECQVFFLKLAQSLPWVVQGRVTSKNLHLFINDILKYQESLFHLVFKSEDVENTEESEKQIKSENSLQELCVQPGNKRKETLVPSTGKKKRMNDDKSTIKISPVPSGINLDSIELQENEFEDEINSYILSPEEQATMREHKMSIWKD